MKKWNSIALSAAALSLLLSATPIYAAQSANTAVIQNHKQTLDQNVTNQIKQTLSKLGVTQPIEITNVDQSFGDFWQIDGTITGKTGVTFSVMYYPAKKNMNTTIVYNSGDLNVMGSILKNKATAFLKTFDTDHKFKPTAIWRVKDPIDTSNQSKDYWVLWGNGQNLKIQLDKGGKIEAGISYNLKDMKASLTNKATNALKTLGIKPIKPFYTADRTKSGSNEFVWNYQDSNNVNRVLIGVKTGKVWEVTNEHGAVWENDAGFAQAFAKPKLSASKALSVAKPKVQSIFGINLTGYNVSIKANQYTFSKKGRTTVIGKINKEGAFFTLKAIPVNGIRN